MTRTSIQDLQHLKPDREKDTPIHLQLYQRYRNAIASGRLRPGERVPSVRSLASELNLARGTVELAYQILGSEGYFLARGPAGTFVSPGLETLGEPEQSALPVPVPRPSSASCAASGTALPFQLGLPALDAFPRKTWSRLAGLSQRTLDLAAIPYPDPAGYGALRQAIATYLGISRGIACTPKQVFVTAGYLGALMLICHSVLRTGDLGWFEDPGYFLVRQFLERAGMRLAPVPVDAEGLDTSLGQQDAAEARFAVVTPSHQSPLGMALSLPRRLALLAWASKHDAWIIEDDYDSEFRYHGRPLPALKSLDRDSRVLYAGTFSKVLFPGLRLAYLVVPASQIERFRDAANHLPGPGAIPLQATVARFMAEGYFARHLRKMRALYAARRAYLVDALVQVFGPGLHIQPQAGGIHVLAFLSSGQGGKAMAAAAQAEGLAVQALEHWHMNEAPRAGLLMGFTNITGPEMAMELALRLKQATDGV